VSAGKYASVTLGGNRSLYFSKIKAGEEYKLIVFQDATGGRTLSFSSRVKWVNDVAPTISSGANTMTVLRFISNGVMLYGVVDQIYDGYAPSVAIDFRDPNIYNDMPSWLDYSGITGNRMYFDSTGKLTWAPNNILLNSATLATQTVAVTVGMTNILSFSGTGSVALSGAATGTLAGTGVNNRVFMVITPTTTSLVLTVTGSVTQAQLERVTYQTSPRPWIPTTSAAVYFPRFDYDPSTTPATPRGLLIEETRTNVVLWSNDFTNAAWVKSNSTDITAVKNETGVDGVASSASSLLCNVANGTILQSMTLASSARFQSCYIKRLVGTGTIWMTMDGGTTWVNVTSDISSNWGRVSIPTQTLANPQAGFKIETAGDKIAVQYFQNTNGTFQSTPIPTTSSSVTRVADIIKLSGSALTAVIANTGSAIIETSNSITSAVSRGFLGSSSARRMMWTPSNVSSSVESFNGSTGLSATIGGSGTWTNGAVRVALGWSPEGRSIVANNGTLATDANAFPSATECYLGSWTTTFQANSWIGSIAFYITRLPDSILKAKSAVGAAF